MNMQSQELYIRTKVNTSSPGELTLMLYNGCIKFMKQALEGIKNQDYNTKNKFIQKSIDIVDELLITLNAEYDISRNLSALYLFIKEKLIEANTKAAPDILNTCIELITELRDTWSEALKIVKTKTPVSL